MDDVAREAGVSRALVSLVMRDSPKVSPQRRERVLTRRGARSATAPTRSPAASPATARSTVGVLLNDLHNPFFAEIANGIEELRVGRSATALLIITGGRREQREQAMLEALLEYRTDGLILVRPRLRRAADRRRRRLGCRCVVIGRRVRDRRIDCVMTDEALGARLAVAAPRRARPRAHRPHRRRPRRGRGAAARRLPARRWREAGLGRRGRGRRAATSPRTAGRAAAAELLLRDGELPTAVFAANDLVADRR